MKYRAPVAVAFLSLFVGAGCAPTEEADTPPIQNASAAVTMETLTALNVPNASQPANGPICAGQLSPDQMDGLKAAGVGSFVSLRLADEKGAGWEEDHASAAGIEFHRMPVAGKAGVTKEAALELAKVLESATQPVVLYCGSSNRVGALLALKGEQLDGMSAEEALAYGKSAGVTGLEAHLKEQLGL